MDFPPNSRDNKEGLRAVVEAGMLLSVLEVCSVAGAVIALAGEGLAGEGRAGAGKIGGLEAAAAVAGRGITGSIGLGAGIATAPGG